MHLFPPNPPPLLPELQKLGRDDWRKLSELGLKLALKIRAGRDAEDVVQRAFARLFDASRWDPTRGAIETHFMLLVKSELLNGLEKAKNERARIKRAKFAGEGTHLKRFEPPPRVVGTLAAIEVVNRVRGLYPNEPVSQRVLQGMVEGDKPTEMADELGVDVATINTVRAKLKYQLRTIGAELGFGDGEGEWSPTGDEKFTDDEIQEDQKQEAKDEPR